MCAEIDDEVPFTPKFFFQSRHFRMNHRRKSLLGMYLAVEQRKHDHRSLTFDVAAIFQIFVSADAPPLASSGFSPCWFNVIVI